MDMLTTETKASVLIEALPYLKKFHGKIFVVKLGGSISVKQENLSNLCEDIVLLNLVGIKTVVIHGGGKMVSDLQNRLGQTPQFHNGFRVTDKKTLESALMVLAGPANKEIVSKINRSGGNAVGLTGADGKTIIAHKKKSEIDLGLVGEIENVNTALLEKLLSADFIPVIAPICISVEGKLYNVNADDAASWIASGLGAEKLVYLSDVKGLMDSGGRLISKAKIDDIALLEKRKIIAGGMIPKLTSAAEAIKNGVKKVHIIDGRLTHSLLIEIFTTSGIGTEITK